ncbi:unnamed protein product [Sphagnum jensenii]|uniref:Uncharacterized protein n=1 Tax=Sphagnum jensenii TaxID=128206 RepID=A0ABP0V7W6_9BRYO
MNAYFIDALYLTDHSAGGHQSGSNSVKSPNTSTIISLLRFLGLKVVLKVSNTAIVTVQVKRDAEAQVKLVIKNGVCEICFAGDSPSIRCSADNVAILSVDCLDNVVNATLELHHSLLEWQRGAADSTISCALGNIPHTSFACDAAIFLVKPARFPNVVYAVSEVYNTLKSRVDVGDLIRSNYSKYCRMMEYATCGSPLPEGQISDSSSRSSVTAALLEYHKFAAVIDVKMVGVMVEAADMSAISAAPSSSGSNSSSSGTAGRYMETGQHRDIHSSKDAYNLTELIGLQQVHAQYNRFNHKHDVSVKVGSCRSNTKIPCQNGAYEQYYERITRDENLLRTSYWLVCQISVAESGQSVEDGIGDGQDNWQSNLNLYNASVQCDLENTAIVLPISIIPPLQYLCMEITSIHRSFIPFSQRLDTIYKCKNNRLSLVVWDSFDVHLGDISLKLLNLYSEEDAVLLLVTLAELSLTKPDGLPGTFNDSIPSSNSNVSDVTNWVNVDEESFLDAKINFTTNPPPLLHRNDYQLIVSRFKIALSGSDFVDLQDNVVGNNMNVHVYVTFSPAVPHTRDLSSTEDDEIDYIFNVGPSYAASWRAEYPWYSDRF